MLKNIKKISATALSAALIIASVLASYAYVELQGTADALGASLSTSTSANTASLTTGIASTSLPPSTGAAASTVVNSTAIAPETVTNQWDIMCLIFQEVDVTVPIFNDIENYHYQGNLTNQDIDNLKSVVNRLPDTFGMLSGGRMEISSIDFHIAEQPLTKVSRCEAVSEISYAMNHDTDISEILDSVLENNSKKYEQVIVIAPITEIAYGWYGLGGSAYKGTWYMQMTYISGDDINDDPFGEDVFIHEILHGLESKGNGMGGNVVSLHNYQQCGYEVDPLYDQRIWYRDFMQNTIKNGANGLPSEVYMVNN